MAISKQRYWFSIDEYGRIMDALFTDNQESKENAWSENFKLYAGTEEILKKAEDPEDFELFPLYRHLGQDDDDFLFGSLEEAQKEYEEQISQEVMAKLYDL